MQRELVEQAQRGDHDAFAVLAGSAFAHLEGAARLILRDPERFDAWLYRILVNACYGELRRSRRATHEADIPDLQHPQARDDISIAIERDALDHGFRTLDPRQRALIVLHLYVGLPLPTVADALDIPLGTAKSRLHRALAELRAALDADARAGGLPEGGVA